MVRKLITALMLITLMSSAKAQSIFKRLKPAKEMYKVTPYGLSAPTMQAWRLVSPVAGYTTDNQVVTGTGIGYNSFHFIDSTQHWYSDWSVNGMIYAGGRVVPSPQANNVTSIGISVGFRDNLILVGPAYNIPLIAGTRGKFIGVISATLPIN